jgi:hypothetical protein
MLKFLTRRVILVLELHGFQCGRRQSTTNTISERLKRSTVQDLLNKFSDFYLAPKIRTVDDLLKGK